MARPRLRNRGNAQRVTRRVGGITLVVAGLLLLNADVGGQDQKQAKQPAGAPRAGSAGRLIRVPLPIPENAERQIKRAVTKALSDMPKGDGRNVLVFEFSSNNKQGGQGSKFGSSLDLANYLSSRELSSVKTVAYITTALNGHAVLPAMACEEIIMAPDARIGAAGIDLAAEEAIDPTMRSGYSGIANRRRTIPPEVAIAMLDKSVEVLKVETEVSPEFVLRSELEALKQRHTIQSQEPLSKPGQLADFSGKEARELGFVKFLAPDRASLAKALSLSASALEDDPSLVGDWRPVQVSVRGAMDAGLASRVVRMIDDQIRGKNVNLVCLWIDSQGGSLMDSMTLVNFLAELDRSQVMTVAYVPAEARADAALVALACDQLVVGREAIIGGPGGGDISPEEIQLAHRVLREEVSPKKQRSWSLAASLIDPELHVYRYTHKQDGRIAYLCPAELQTQEEPEAWEQGEEVTRAGRVLQLRGERAHELGLARHVASDFNGLKEFYGLEDEVLLAEPGWAHYLIEALAAPTIAWLLLLIGGAALYAELQAPGIGVGAFVAGVCFLLYFWSKHLDGTAGWLEVLLFLSGICCILLELFVLPGVAVFGLGGGLMVIASLVLASQTFVFPHNDYQLSQLRDSMLGLLGAGAGVVVLALLMHRFLPHTPFFSHVVLQPPSDRELEALAHRESLVDLGHLLGREGVATTQLTPSGKARFQNEIIDVIADGEVVDRGAQVVVTAVQGNRVVVRSAT